MKKFAVTGFAALYAVLVVSVTTERARVWASRQTPTLSDQTGQESRSFKFKASDCHTSRTKLYETEFADQRPRESASGLESEAHALLWAFEPKAALDGRSTPTRSPPFTL